MLAFITKTEKKPDDTYIVDVDGHKLPALTWRQLNQLNNILTSACASTPEAITKDLNQH